MFRFSVFRQIAKISKRKNEKIYSPVPRTPAKMLNVSVKAIFHIVAFRINKSDGGAFSASPSFRMSYRFFAVFLIFLFFFSVRTEAGQSLLQLTRT